MMAAILNSAILYSAIWTKKLHSCILTQIDDCSYVEICHPWFSHFVQKELHSFISLNLMMAAILNSAIMEPAILHKKITSLIHSNSTWWWSAILNSAMLDSETAILDSDDLLSSLRFTQKHSSLYSDFDPN